MLKEAAEFLIDQYQSSKGNNPTKHCIINGVGCSERFRQDIQDGVNSGLSAESAVGRAAKNKLEECQKLNNVERLKAAGNIILGGVSVLAVGSVVFSGLDCNDSDPVQRNRSEIRDIGDEVHGGSDWRKPSGKQPSIEPYSRTMKK